MSNYKPLSFPADIPAYGLERLRRIDEAAWELGIKILVENPSPEQLRKRATEYEDQGLLWLSVVNRDLADALEKDVRLAAMPTIAAANGDWFVGLYAGILSAHVRGEEYGKQD